MLTSDAVSLTDTASVADAAAATARFRVKIVTRAEIAGCPAWAATFADRRKDHRYYEILEDTLRDRVDYRYFAIIDQAARIQAVQPFFLLDQDILEGLGAEWQTWLARIRRFVPRFLKMRTLMVGCFAGEGHLAGSDTVPCGEMAEILCREIVNLARSCRAQLIVLKEFPAHYRPVLDCFVRRGFARVPSMPMTALNIEHDDFDAYMQNALPRSARWQLRKKFKATDGETLALTVIDDARDAIDEIYPLYLQVFDRSKFRFEKLTADYFRRLGRDMKDKTLFFIWRRGGKVVAFSLCMVEGDSLFWEYVGLDYAVALDLHLYYYTIREARVSATNRNSGCGTISIRSIFMRVFAPRFRTRFSGCCCPGSYRPATTRRCEGSRTTASSGSRSDMSDATLCAALRKAPGFDVPATLLARADVVIE
jgi:Peptidogalycan biosysnthesis/recognition